MLKLYNTETRLIEEVRPADGRTIKMYTCGPTIYDFAHIGNFRTYVFEDLLRRAIQFFGFAIEQAMNITDIDDKTIRGAIRQNIPLKQYTDPFKEAFFEDLGKLYIQKVEHYPEATAYIPQMIQMIETLMKKGYAYKSQNGSIYFSIRKFPKYGRLSHLKLSDLKENASGENEADEYEKDNIADFVLWKIYDPARDGQIYWESPFGKGRPGWHIECSAMSASLLGEPIDIHCGGVDNMFPHHENEIAQSECCSGHLFVRHWIHVEHLLVDQKKMSKSLGNFYTLRDLLQRGYTGKEVRYLLLSTHYRTQLNFTFAGLDAARSSLQRIEDLVLRLRSISADRPKTDGLKSARIKFKEALADDLNISAALAVLFDLIRELNTLCDRNQLGNLEALEALQLLSDWDRVLGVLPLEKKSEEIPLELLQFLDRRESARREKNWRLSDEMRDAITARGYVIEDTPQGARLKKK
ncbi:MAG: cysteine--tRNA ligase [Verrucomicrobia bacterium]|nr:cysteine--tRNA ligase [Verrucomicrobiota bacterium]MBU6445806.1 cysteine--tRNA ligase [Verrucomicrobiota bacterium]MDE3047971.1 cysteine--tRNA ligase [Verrucomicrobiota bacterium]